MRSRLETALVYPSGPSWLHCLPVDLVSRTSLQNIVAEAALLGCISFRLPTLNSVAGGVLRHAVKTVDSLLLKYSPMLFKLGYTHDPVWRWNNNIYGYKKCRDNWASMIVLYITDEPYSAAMLEAALIQKYQSTNSWKMVPSFCFPKICLYIFS